MRGAYRSTFGVPNHPPGHDIVARSHRFSFYRLSQGRRHGVNLPGDRTAGFCVKMVVNESERRVKDV